MLTLFSGCLFSGVRCLGSLELCLIARETTRDSWTLEILGHSSCKIDLVYNGADSITLVQWSILQVKVLKHESWFRLTGINPTTGLLRLKNLKNKKELIPDKFVQWFALCGGSASTSCDCPEIQKTTKIKLMVTHQHFWRKNNLVKKLLRFS